MEEGNVSYSETIINRSERRQIYSLLQCMYQLEEESLDGISGDTNWEFVENLKKSYDSLDIVRLTAELCNDETPMDRFKKIVQIDHNVSEDQIEELAGICEWPHQLTYSLLEKGYPFNPNIENVFHDIFPEMEDTDVKHLIHKMNDFTKNLLPVEV